MDTVFITGFDIVKLDKWQDFALDLDEDGTVKDSACRMFKSMDCGFLGILDRLYFSEHAGAITLNGDTLTVQIEHAAAAEFAQWVVNNAVEHPEGPPCVTVIEPPDWEGANAQPTKVTVYRPPGEVQ